MMPPRAAASVRRRSASSQLSEGRLLAASSSNGLILCGGELFDPERGELEQLVEARPRERRLLRRGLNLNERTVTGHDDVHVDVRGRILRIVEVEQRGAADDPDGDGGDRPCQRLRETEAVERALRRDICAGDGRAARASIRLKDVAVDPQRPLAERAEVGDRTDRAADQALYLHRAAALLAA